MASEFYLERVGLEANVRLRLNLKNGPNLIGRCETKDVDFGIDSKRCSARHCIITVSRNSVEIENLSKTTGTTVNADKMSDKKKFLRENDIIGIVRDLSMPWDLRGNYNLFVYRLRRYTSDNLLTIEIDDDETYEISDDDDPNENLILDPVDVKQEHDLRVELSLNFNAEIKEEQLDIEEFENYCVVVKREPSNFFEIESNVNAADEVIETGTFDPDRAGNDRNGADVHQPESNDSTDTIVFSPTHQQDDRSIESNLTDSTETSDMVRRSSLVNVGSGRADKAIYNGCKAAVRNHETEVHAKVCDPMDVEQSETKVVDNAKRKEGHSQRKEKSSRSKTKSSDSKTKSSQNKSKSSQCKDKSAQSKENSTQSKTKPEPAEQNNKAKSKRKDSCEMKEMNKTTAKVKYTKDNRGAFLTDPTQMPGLPASIKDRRKSTMLITPLPLPCKSNPTVDKEIDDILSKIDFKKNTPPIKDTSYSPGFKKQTPPIRDTMYSSFKVKKLSFSDLPKSSAIESVGSSFKSPVHNGTTSPDAPNYDDNPSPAKIKKNSYNEPIVRQAYNGNGRNNSHSAPNNDAPGENNLKHKTAGKGSMFQINPCHEIISILTAYDADQYKTVDAFCRSIDTSVEPFRDTFTDYADYQKTILPLMMLELWKEIEIEYTKSVAHQFMTVSVTDKNIEKRGDGRRMVFHCQVDVLCGSPCLADGHIVVGRYEFNRKQIEFLAVITNISYIRKTAERRFAHFTMETSGLAKIPPIDSLQIRPITVISNTLNAFRSIYSLDNSPLVNLILNPLSGELPEKFTADSVVYKAYPLQLFPIFENLQDTLDTNQTSVLKAIYKRCINLNAPNISLLDGAAGTGKTLMVSNLALQLVYGDSLPKPLRILICTRSNRNIDEITKKLLHVRDRTSLQKIQLVRFGYVEQMDKAVRCVSVQHMKQNEQRFLELANLDKLDKEKKTLELKIKALDLDDEFDHAAELKLWKSKLVKVDTLYGRLAAIDKKKLKDATTVLLNACDVICTTFSCISKLQNYIPNVDVCIIDDATQCNESLSLLPFRFGMSSLVLTGDSRFPPPMAYSAVANEKNYNNSLFSRFQKLFMGKSGSPIYRINIQHRMHPEILKWPNLYFYNHGLLPVAKVADTFPIVPFKMLSYLPVQTEIDNIMMILDVLLSHVDCEKYSIGVICTDSKQLTIIQNRIKDHRHVATNSAEESHLLEKDVIIVWISKEHGTRHLFDNTLFNRAVTRAKRCLLICGADLMSYKSRPVWQSIMENAQTRKCFHHMKTMVQQKLVHILRKKSEVI